MNYLYIETRYFIGALLFLFIFVNSGCDRPGDLNTNNSSEQDEEVNSILLEVQDSFYFNSDFNDYLYLVAGENTDRLDYVSLSRLFDNFVEEKMLLEAAKKQNIILSSEEQKQYLVKLSRESWINDKKSSLDEKESMQL